MTVVRPPEGLPDGDIVFPECEGLAHVIEVNPWGCCAAAGLDSPPVLDDVVHVRGRRRRAEEEGEEEGEDGRGPPGGAGVHGGRRCLRLCDLHYVAMIDDFDAVCTLS